MNSEGYKIPLGVDFGDATSNIDALINKLTDAQKAANDVQGELQKSNRIIASGAKEANDAQSELLKTTLEAKKGAEERAKAERVLSKAFEEVNKRQQENIQLSEKQEKAIAEYTRRLEYNKKALKEAMDPTQIAVLSKEIEKMQANIVKHFENASKQIDETKNKLKDAGDLTDKISDSLTGMLTDSDFEELGKAINASGNEMEQLGALIDFISNKMEGMDKESELFKELTKDIETANNMLGRINDNVDISTYSFDQLNDRLRYLQSVLKSEINPQEIIRINQEIERTSEQLNRIKNAGKEGFDELGNKLIPDAEDKVKTLNTELRETVQELAKMRMAGKFDTEEYDELLDKAGQIKSSISEVGSELKRVSSTTRGLDALIDTSKLIAAGFGVAQGAAHLFGKENEDVQKTIVKLTASISVLQGLQQIQVELKNKESVANKALTASQALYTVVVGKSTGALKAFRVALAATGIGLIALAIGALITNWDKLTASIKISEEASEKWGARFDRVKQVAMGVGNVILQNLIAPIKALYVLMTDGPKAAIKSFKDSLDVAKNYSIGVGNEIQRQNDKMHKKNLEDQRDALEKQIELQRAKGEETVELERALLSTRLALSKKGSEEQKELLHDLELFEAKIGKDKADRLKKEGEEAKQRAKEAEKRRQEELQRIAEFNRKLIDLAFEREEREAELRLKGQAKEEEMERIRFAKELEGLRRQLQDFEGTEAERVKLKQEVDKLIELAEEDHAAKMMAIGIDYANKAAENQRLLNRTILQLHNENEQLEIDAIKEKYEKITEQLIESGKSQIEAEKMVVEARERDVSAVRQKYALKALDEREEADRAKNAKIKIDGIEQNKLTELREKEDLRIMIEYAKKRIAILRASGNSEDMAKADRLEALIEEWTSNLNAEGEKGGVIARVLGLNPEQEKYIVDLYKKIFKDFAKAYDESLRLQIKSKQNQINALTSQINSVERELDRELEAQEKGYANNVDAKRKEMEALQAEREKEIAAEEELQKKRQKLAAAEIAINGAVQSSELAVAAAKIFKNNAGIPIMGVALATAAVATMITTFMSIKNQVKAMQESVPTFRKGGAFVLDGPSHESGGLGVYNEKTGKRVAEVEGGEGFFAINKKSTGKYRDILEAFNNDDLKTVGNMVDDLLDGTGVITSDKDQHGKVVLIANQNEAKKNALNFDNQSLKEIAESNRSLLDHELSKEDVQIDGDYIIIRKGNRTRKIKRKK